MEPTQPGYLQQAWPVSRTLKRHQLDVSVTALGGNGTPVSGVCHDISQGGLGVTMEAAFRLGEEIALCFALPGCEGSLKVRGVVRYVAESRFGFEFLTLLPEQLQHIRDYEILCEDREAAKRRIEEARQQASENRRRRASAQGSRE